ncbi:MAG TPA: Gmad2 immunoglobulin-like domain-containing protein, partial [Acidimicrobiales bacterium]|nr:Gmad2 immunoglobulin-like domain-containing protein [Acidimicrobiales bacterium]
MKAGLRWLAAAMFLVLALPPAVPPAGAAPAVDSLATSASASASETVLAFGDAVFHGSTGADPLKAPVIDIATTPDGGGYWLVAADGGIFTFGDAAFVGSGAGTAGDTVVGLAPTSSGAGYWLATTGPGYFPGFWPAATPAGALAVQAAVDGGAGTWRRDPAEVARAFTRAVLGWSIVVDGAVVRGSAAEGWTAAVTFRPLIGEGPLAPGSPHRLDLVGLRGAERPAWFAAGLLSRDVVARVPAPGAFVASPMRVAGIGSGFEATLNTTVRDDDGRVLHPRAGADEGYVMGGATEPEP